MKVAGSNKKIMGSVRAKAGMVAKAGSRRLPHIKSASDGSGKRQWVAA